MGFLMSAPCRWQLAGPLLSRVRFLSSPHHSTFYQVQHGGSETGILLNPRSEFPANIMMEWDSVEGQSSKISLKYNVMWQPGWKGSLGENGYKYIYGEYLRCPPATITTLLIGYTPIQNTK